MCDVAVVYRDRLPSVVDIRGCAEPYARADPRDAVEASKLKGKQPASVLVRLSIPVVY